MEILECFCLNTCYKCPECGIEKHGTLDSEFGFKIECEKCGTKDNITLVSKGRHKFLYSNSFEITPNRVEPEVEIKCKECNNILAEEI